jgi:hypothetical protein
MKTSIRILFFLISLALVFGCAHRYYLGFHGPSIKAHPEVHANVSSDSDCLQCHHPDKNPYGPPTSHPQFKGCLKCHND